MKVSDHPMGPTGAMAPPTAPMTGSASEGAFRRPRTIGVRGLRSIPRAVTIATLTVFSASVLAHTDPDPAVFIPCGATARVDGILSGAVLNNGSVLVTYGTAAQVFDPAQRTWSAPIAMLDQQVYAATVTLPDGRVLVAGTGLPGDHPSAELFTPATGRFTLVGPMAVPRYNPQAVLLSTGDVLITGGRKPGTDTTPVSTSELFSPTTLQFRTTGSPAMARIDPTLTVLNDGRVLLAGGLGGAAGVFQNSAEIYTPATGRFTPTGSMRDNRSDFAAARLPDGRVLVAGGWHTSGHSIRAISDAELYDPTTGTFSPTPWLNQTRHGFTMSPLPDGRILIAAGQSDSLNYIVDTEAFDPVALRFDPLDAPMSQGRQESIAVSLGDGRVLIAGGHDDHDLLGSVEQFTPDRIWGSGFE